MELVFTKNVGRFKSGQTLDYPKSTWDQIAKSAKMKLADFAVAPKKPLVDLENKGAKK